MNHESTPLRRLNRPYWLEAEDERPAPAPACETVEESPVRPPKRKRAYRRHIEPAGTRGQLSRAQLEQLQAVAQTYTPDLHDAAAVEVLLVLLEVGHILELSEGQLDRIFGPRCLRVLNTWGDVIPPRP